MTEYHSVILKNEGLHLQQQMDLQGNLLTEIGQAEKDKYCLISLIWGT